MKKPNYVGIYLATTSNINMTFGQALELAKLGRKVKRSTWRKCFMGCTNVDIGNYVYINTDYGTCRYTPTSEDLLAEDWYEVM